MKEVDTRTVISPNERKLRSTEVYDERGLPIVNYQMEFNALLAELVGIERYMTFDKDNVFLGIGDQGCRLVSEFYKSWGHYLTNSTFLMIEEPVDVQQPVNEDDSNFGPVRGTTSASLSLHLLPAAIAGPAVYYGQGERLAAEDQELEDRLRRVGVKPSARKQIVYLITALGGGIGSGVSPYVLQKVKDINPNCRCVVIALMPAADEPDSSHFNTLCALSGIIDTEGTTPADMILLIDQERLRKLRGLGGVGEELARESLLCHMLAIFAGAIDKNGSSQADPGHLTKMNRSMGVYAFAPCVAMGRSLEIFGELPNILESAISFPLAPIDRQAITLSYILVRIPERLASNLQENRIKADINKWNRANFPRLKGSVLQLSYSGNGGDRLDICLLLGGTSLAFMAGRAKEGFDRFKTIVTTKSWEEEFGATSRSVIEVDRAIELYDHKIEENPS